MAGASNYVGFSLMHARLISALVATSTAQELAVHESEARRTKNYIPQLGNIFHIGRKKGLRAEAGKPDLVLLNSW